MVQDAPDAYKAPLGILARAIILLGGSLGIYAYAQAENILYDDSYSTALGTCYAANCLFPVSDLTGNTVIVDYFSNNNPHEVLGAYRTTAGDVSNNTVSINNGYIIGSVYGGYVSHGLSQSYNNDVTMNAGTVTWSIVGGISYNSHHNSVTMHGGTVGSLIGGDGQMGQAHNNQVTITGGTITNTGLALAISGGYVNGGNSYDNIINISGGSITGNIYAGSYDATAHSYDNTLNINGSPNLSGASLYGGNDGNNNNTLSYHAQPIHVQNIANFEHYNFTIPASAVNGSSLITASGTVNIGGANIRVKAIEAGSPLNAGDAVNLIDARSGTLLGSANTIDSIITQGVSLIYQVEVRQTGDLITATIVSLTNNNTTPAIVNPQVTTLSEGRLAGLAFTTQGADLAANAPAHAYINQAEPGWNLFGITDGSTYRYNSSAHVNIDGFSALTGAIYNNGSGLFAGGFIEGGWGNYESHNRFNYVTDVRGDGHTRYYGIGALGRYDFQNGIYLDASARAGRSKTDFTSQDLVSANGEIGRYDSQSAYYSAHIGAGYQISLSEQTRLDLSAKYLWTHLSADHVSVAGDPVNFKSANSYRARLTGHIYHQISNRLTLMGGLGYEYEFDGHVDANVYQIYSIKRPSLGSGSGIVELGAYYTPASHPRLTLHTRIQGYVGRKEGVNGTVSIRYAF